MSTWTVRPMDLKKSESISFPQCIVPKILGWPKTSFGFLCNILQKNLNKLFDQSNTWLKVALRADPGNLYGTRLPWCSRAFLPKDLDTPSVKGLQI